MNTVQTLKEKAMQGVSITKEEALSLADQPLDELCQAANELREHFCDNVFDLCSIINGLQILRTIFPFLYRCGRVSAFRQHYYFTGSTT